ncbi:MAG TPA: hypothetical protein VFA46_02680 [Actinomycetes bacterium]|nr:hypothetical protein [Actinomycetes bacterium]
MNAVRTAPRPQAAPSPRPPRPARTPSAAWYWVAAGIAVIGLAAAAVWAVAGIRDYRQRIDGFARVTAPGQVAVQVSGTGNRVLYYEGAGSPSLSQLGILVADPAGVTVQVHGYLGDLRYDAPGGTVGRALGSFRADTTGTYQVRVTSTAVEGGQIAVGDNFMAKTVASVLMVVALALVALGGSLALAVVTVVRRSR